DFDLLVGLFQVLRRRGEQHRDVHLAQPLGQLLRTVREDHQVRVVPGHGRRVRGQGGQVGARGVLRVVGVRVHRDDLVAGADRVQGLGGGGRERNDPLRLVGQGDRFLAEQLHLRRERRRRVGDRTGGAGARAVRARGHPEQQHSRRAQRGYSTETAHVCARLRPVQAGVGRREADAAPLHRGWRTSAPAQGDLTRPDRAITVAAQYRIRTGFRLSLAVARSLRNEDPEQGRYQELIEGHGGGRSVLAHEGGSAGELAVTLAWNRPLPGRSLLATGLWHGGAGSRPVRVFENR